MQHDVHAGSCHRCYGRSTSCRSQEVRTNGTASTNSKISLNSDKKGSFGNRHKVASLAGRVGRQRPLISTALPLRLWEAAHRHPLREHRKCFRDVLWSLWCKRLMSERQPSFEVWELLPSFCRRQHKRQWRKYRIEESRRSFTSAKSFAAVSVHQLFERCQEALRRTLGLIADMRAACFERRRPIDLAAALRSALPRQLVTARGRSR